MINERTQPKRRFSVGGHRIKQADGLVTECSSRVAKSGSQAHSFYIGTDEFSIFTDDKLSPVIVGDRVRFDYEIRRLKSGNRNEYFSVIPESLTIIAPSEFGGTLEGNLYVLSNPSMPGLLKIGYTTGTVAKRVSELSGVTGVPTGFKVEWSLPIVGDPRAVEQRAHAHLATKRRGKEFFKVSLDEAKNACTQSFAELYPELASSMGEAFAARAKAEIQRRNDLERLASEREMEREKEAQQQAFDATREGRWLKEGSCEVVLRDFQHEPKRGQPSFFLKVVGLEYTDFLEFVVHPTQDYDGGTMNWCLNVSGRVRNKAISKSENFMTQVECMEQLALAMQEPVSNQRAKIRVHNIFIDNPPELPEAYQDPRATLTLKSLDGLVIRPVPAKEKRNRRS
ncbi:GIY-YIG nuclease family protein [Rhizobium sp. RAF56]|uniref:GIY-YIG nuclease family protein n=1 Tax=Rhizobium sp. RAF56 TaxID=3233062 RepID=UPI003F987BB5